MGTADHAAYALLFFIGWISGGGIMAILSMATLVAVGVPIANEYFVLGCLWGSWGIVMGRWMGRHWLNNTRQQGGRADG